MKMSNPITRLYNWVNDKLASVKITASRMDAEFDQIVAALNQKVVIKATAPDSPINGMMWYDTSTNLLKIYVGTSWSIVDYMGKGADVASAATTTLGDDGSFFDITGTTTITSITAKTAGKIVFLQFDGVLTVTDGSNLKLNGDFITAAESVLTLISDGTNWWEVSRRPAFVPTAANALAGSVVQVVNYQTGAYALGSTTTPYDDTIPQNTEGDEFMTLSITPKSATNKLKIDVTVIFGHGANSYAVTALFQDSTADALAACKNQNGVSTGEDMHNFTHYMTAGTTSSTTFKVRIGATGGNIYFNGNNAPGRLLGGVSVSSITITEIKV
jgi:hypothetical protein